MQGSEIGLVLGFFLIFLDLKHFAQGKAFPEDEDEYKHLYNQKLSQFQPIYKRNLRPKAYYPHIDGKPLFIPPPAGSLIHVNKRLGDHERNEYSQSWTFTSPVEYDYDSSSQKDYYEDTVTSNSMIKKLLDSYDTGVHHGDYHILSSTPESYVSFSQKQTNKSLKKSDKQDLRKKDTRKNKYLHDILKDPNSKSKLKAMSPYVASGVTDVMGKKLPTDQVAEDLIDMTISDYKYIMEDNEDKEEIPEYASETVAEKKFSNPDEAVGTKLPDYFHASTGMNNKGLSGAYKPKVEVISKTVSPASEKELISSKTTDDYSPEVVKVFSSKPTNDYSPEVVKLGGLKPIDEDYSPEVVKVVGLKPIDEDYSPEVVKVVGLKPTDEDYSPEVVKVVGLEPTDKDYSPEGVKVIGSQSIDSDYSPEVVNVVGSKHTDDYSSEEVKKTETKYPEDKSIEVKEKSVYSPEIKKVINTKHRTKQHYRPKRKLFNTDDNDYEKVESQEPFTSEFKIKIKNDKRIKTKSPNKVSSDVHKLGNKKSKLVYKNKSKLVKSEMQDPNEYLISIKKNSHSKPIAMNSGNLDYNKETEYTVKRDDSFKENSNKIKTMTPKNVYLIHKNKNIRVNDDLVTDSSKSTFSQHGTSTHKITTDLSEDEFREKMEDNSRDLLIDKPLDSDESFQAFDLESTGSGDFVDNENSRSVSLFSDEDFPRSLSTLNSNVWSLIFNPNAEFKKVKKCITRSNEPGFCMYVQQCDIPNVVTSLEQLLQDACVIDDIFIGICCPEFPVQTVKVHWDQIPSDTNKRTDDFAHKSDGELIKFWCAGYEESLTNLLNKFSLADCGIRSDAALKAQSWPWKAPLVSMSNGRIFCDGVLIRDNYVLTAAHCTRRIPKNQILVRLGQHDESSGEDYAVVEIKRHAQYNSRTMLHDIALLKLGRRIRHDEYTNRICIHDEDDDDDDDDHDHHHDDDDDDDDDDEDDHAGERAILLGSRGRFNMNSNKDERLKVMTNKECEQKLGMRVPATMLCTEARNENERSCNTDSGAPLIIKDDNKYEVIGILSWNRNDCDSRFPSIFSRVSKYVRWIKKHTV